MVAEWLIRSNDFTTQCLPRKVPIRPFPAPPGCWGAGRAKIAKKLAEEAVEVVIDAMNGDRAAVIRESADLLYNLVVVWAASGVQPSEVWNEMSRREQLFGIAEKLPKRDVPTKGDSKSLALKANPA